MKEKRRKSFRNFHLFAIYIHRIEIGFWFYAFAMVYLSIVAAFLSNVPIYSLYPVVDYEAVFHQLVRFYGEKHTIKLLFQSAYCCLDLFFVILLFYIIFSSFHNIHNCFHTNVLFMEFLYGVIEMLCSYMQGKLLKIIHQCNQPVMLQYLTQFNQIRVKGCRKQKYSFLYIYFV